MFLLTFGRTLAVLTPMGTTEETSERTVVPVIRSLRDLLLRALHLVRPLLSNTQRKWVAIIAEYIFCVNCNLKIVLCVHMIPWVNLKLSQSSYLCAPLFILLLLLVFDGRVSILLEQYWWVYEKKCLTITVPRYQYLSKSLAFFVLKPHCAKSVLLYINFIYAAPNISKRKFWASPSDL